MAMYPPCPLPRHITALYMVAVVSSIALFSQSITIVGADILVYSTESHEQIEVVFRDMPSRFGDSLPIEGLKGYFVYADPAQACSPVKPPPNLLNFTGQWILLIMRGTCPFDVKVRNAQQSNYDAAIVHNVNSSDLEPMSASNATGIHIPSVFVGETTGFLLRANYQYNQGYYILVNDDMPFNINTHLLLPFATVVGICCIIMIVFMVLKCFQNRRRQRRHRLPPSSLRQIPTSKFRKTDPYETCAICLEDYVEGEKLRILPCVHAYHSKCIDPWLTRNRRVCPVCKRKVFAQDEHISDSDSDTDADDTTPLVRPFSQGTQGGTFESSNAGIVFGALLGPSPSSSSSGSVSPPSVFTSDNDAPSESQPVDAEGVNRPSRGDFLSKRSRRREQQNKLESSSSVSTHSMCLDSSSASFPSSGGRTEEVDDHGAVPCYGMSSGEHSINSRLVDLKFSDDHFEQDRSSSRWGSRVALQGSRGEPDEPVEPAEAAEEAVLPPAVVRSPSSSSVFDC